MNHQKTLVSFLMLVSTLLGANAIADDNQDASNLSSEHVLQQDQAPDSSQQVEAVDKQVAAFLQFLMLENRSINAMLRALQQILPQRNPKILLGVYIPFLAYGLDSVKLKINYLTQALTAVSSDNFKEKISALLKLLNEKYSTIKLLAELMNSLQGRGLFDLAAQAENIYILTDKIFSIDQQMELIIKPLI